MTAISQVVRKAFQVQDPVCAKKLIVLLDQAKEGLETELELCKNWKQFVNEFEESKKKYILVVNGKEITSLEVLYESMRISKEFELDPTFTVFDDKGKKVFRNFLSYNRARTRWGTTMNYIMEQTSKHWNDIDLADFVKHAPKAHNRKSEAKTSKQRNGFSAKIS